MQISKARASFLKYAAKLEDFWFPIVDIISE